MFYNQNGSKPGFGSGGKFAGLSGAPAIDITNLIVKEDVRDGTLFKLQTPVKYAENIQSISTFDASTDQIVIDRVAIGIDDAKPSFSSFRGWEPVKKLASQDVDFIYGENTGSLFYNQNGAEPGFGSGGLFVKLVGAPEITENNLQFI